MIDKIGQIAAAVGREVNGFLDYLGIRSPRYLLHAFIIFGSGIACGFFTYRLLTDFTEMGASGTYFLGQAAMAIWILGWIYLIWVSK